MCDWNWCGFCRDQDPALYANPKPAQWKFYINDPCFYCKQVISQDHIDNVRYDPEPRWLQGKCRRTYAFEGPIVWSHTACFSKNNPKYPIYGGAPFPLFGTPEFRGNHLMPSQLIRGQILENMSEQSQERSAIKSREELQFSEISQSFLDEYTKPILTDVVKRLPEGNHCIGIIKNFLENYIDETCPICQNRIISWPFDKSIVSTSCGHIFHGSCLQKWIITKKNCPMCRSIVEPNGLKIITIDTKLLDDKRMCILIDQLTSLFTHRHLS